MLNSRVVLIAVITGFLLLTGAVIALFVCQPKTAYVNVAEVYNEFTLKKELEKKLLRYQENAKIGSDSLLADLNAMYSSLKDAGKTKGTPEFERKRQVYMSREQQIKESSEALTAQYTEQIWKQLNQYIKDYGKDHNYTYIYGAEGSGSLMYSDPGRDITEEVKKYVNDKYNGNLK